MLRFSYQPFETASSACLQIPMLPPPSLFKGFIHLLIKPFSQLCCLLCISHYQLSILSKAVVIWKMHCFYSVLTSFFLPH